MRRFFSSVLVLLLAASVAAPSAWADVPSRSLVPPCCMGGNHHSCARMRASQSGRQVSATCSCNSCELSQAAPPAQAEPARNVDAPLPLFTFADEFYGASDSLMAVPAAASRAPPLASLQRIRGLGSLISAAFHRCTAVVTRHV